MLFRTPEPASIIHIDAEKSSQSVLKIIQKVEVRDSYLAIAGRVGCCTSSTTIRRSTSEGDDYLTALLKGMVCPIHGIHGRCGAAGVDGSSTPGCPDSGHQDITTSGWPDVRTVGATRRTLAQGACGRAGSYWQMCSVGGRSLSLPNAVTHRLLGLEHVPAADAVGWHISWLA